jgi:hypothetical protein
MSVCTTCGTGELKTVRGASRRSFFQTCTNRRCKATFELVLDIADAVSTLPKVAPKKSKKDPSSDAND